MIITRSPLRISLGGGGTDLPSYYQEFGGFLIAAAINKYVYATVMRPFTQGIFLKYSKIENVQTVLEVKHPIIREVLHELNQLPVNEEEYTRCNTAHAFLHKTAIEYLQKTILFNDEHRKK